MVVARRETRSLIICCILSLVVGPVVGWGAFVHRSRYRGCEYRSGDGVFDKDELQSCENEMEMNDAQSLSCCDEDEWLSS